jgi:hypothetical protein
MGVGGSKMSFANISRHIDRAALDLEVNLQSTDARASAEGGLGGNARGSSSGRFIVTPTDAGRRDGGRARTLSRTVVNRRRGATAC